MQNKIQKHCGVLSPQSCRSCQEPAPARASYRITNSFGNLPALMLGLPETAGRSLLPHIPGEPPPPPYSPTLVSPELFLVCAHSSCICTGVSLPLLESIIPEGLPPLLMGPALANIESILELDDIGFDRCRGSFWQLHTENIPLPLCLPKPCHANLVQLFMSGPIATTYQYKIFGKMKPNL